LRFSHVKIFTFSLITFLYLSGTLWASPVNIEPPNSFTVEFTSDGKLNLTANLFVPEESIADLLYRLDLDEMGVEEAEGMLEENLRACFDEQIAEWRSYEGYPKHQAKLADIEKYEIDGRRKDGFYRLRYRLELRSRQVMRILDPTFAYVEEDDKVRLSLMLHFPFPDIPIAEGISLFELAGGAMQYIIVLSKPISNPKPELCDIRGFLSATAYSASFVVHPDEYIPIRLVGRVTRDVFPGTKNEIGFEIRDDHSGLINARMTMGKKDFKRICRRRGVELVEALRTMKEQYEDFVQLSLPDWIEREIVIETDETTSELIFILNIELPSLPQFNLWDGVFEYAVVGDWTFIDLPLSNPFDPANLPFCEGSTIRPNPCTFTITMPGRIDNANEIRASGLQFKVGGNRVSFHLPPGAYKHLNVSSDSLGF